MRKTARWFVFAAVALIPAAAFLRIDADVILPEAWAADATVAFIWFLVLAALIVRPGLRSACWFATTAVAIPLGLFVMPQVLYPPAEIHMNALGMAMISCFLAVPATCLIWLEWRDAEGRREMVLDVFE